MNQNDLIEKITKEVMQQLQKTNEFNSVASQLATVNSVANKFGIHSPQDLGIYIDHTLLKPEAESPAYDQLCKEAVDYGFFSVCVNSSWVPYVSKKLRGTNVRVCSVVGFPLGTMTSRSKAFETREAIAQGATEIDMVMAIGKLKTGEYKFVEEDILAVRRATRGSTILKVIIETSMLTEEEKILACQIAKKAGADFVKTSTGFSGGGATVEDVLLMKRVVGKNVQVKASGGIRDFETAIAMLEAGATRIGTGSGVALVQGQKSTSAY